MKLTIASNCLKNNNCPPIDAELCVYNDLLKAFAQVFTGNQHIDISKLYPSCVDNLGAGPRDNFEQIFKEIDANGTARCRCRS